MKILRYTLLFGLLLTFLPMSASFNEPTILPQNNTVAANDDAANADDLADYPQLQQAFAQSTGQDNPVYYVEQDEAGYAVTNPDHSYAVRFEDDGVTLVKNTETWHMQLTHYGYANTLQEVETAEITTVDNHVTYERGNLSEWYINSSMGLQQGFTIDSPPSDNDSDDLMLNFDLSGTLATDLQGDTLHLTSENGIHLTYGGLYAYDANGQTLPARFELVDNLLAIVVNDTDATYPITIDPWIQQQKLIASDGEDGDKFGFSVAIDGNTALIGAPSEDSNNIFGGAIYVYMFDGNTWVETQKLVTPQPIQAHLGESLALDGDTAVIGGCNLAYVYVRTNNSWDFQQELIPNDPATGKFFGYAVAVSGDTALIGAERDNESGSTAGAAYVFVRNGTTWSQQQKLVPPAPAGNDQFGTAVAIDGNTVLIGSPFDDDSASSAGAAYVFVRNGTTWSQQQKLLPDANSNAWSGSSVALDGNTAIVSSPRDDDSGSRAGAVYVWIRDNISWSRQQKILPPDGTQFGSRFGNGGVAIDGDLIVVGKHFDNEAGESVTSGGVYIFERNGNTWNYQQKIFSTTPIDNARFGFSVSISNKQILAGAYSITTGAAYIYTFEPGVTLSTDTINVSEDGATDTLDITLDTVPIADVTINLDFSNGAPNGAEISNPLPPFVISSGTQVPVTLTIAGLDDAEFEGMHSDTLTINVSSADPDYDGATVNFLGGSGADNNEVTVNITDNETPPEVSLSPTTITHNEENADTVAYEFTVTLSEAVNVPVTVDYSTNDDTATTADSDYVDNDNTLIFNPGDPLTQIITVEVNGDTLFELDEDFTVTLNSATNATIDGVNNSSTGTITNDDAQPVVDITPAAVAHAEGDADTTSYGFTVTLSNETGVPITIDYTTSDNTATLTDNDYIDNDNTLTFNPGDPLTQIITVEVNGDAVLESDEDFTVTLDSATNATIDGSNNTVMGIITNDDIYPGVSLSPANVTHDEGDADTMSYEFTVTLSTEVGFSVTVDYSTNDDTATLADNDYVDNDNTLTFNPGDPLTQDITVEVNGDNLFELDENFTVTLNSATNGIIEGVDNSSTGTITNDDVQPVVNLMPATIVQAEGDLDTTRYEFTVTLSTETGAPVTVDYSTNDDTATLADNDYVDNDNTLTFNPGDPLTQDITILVNGDTLLEADEDFTVTLDSVTNATIDGVNDTAIGTITNDDIYPGVSLSPANVTHNEGDAGTTSYDFTVILSIEPDFPVTVDYSTNDGTAIATDNDYIDNDNTLTFNPGDPLTQTITVLVNGDTFYENDEDFTVTLDSVTNGVIDSVNNSSTGTITNDDDEPTLNITPIWVTHDEGDAGTTSYEFAVNLSTNIAMPVSVDFITYDDTATLADNDYIEKAVTLTFNPSDPLTQTVIVEVIGDTISEADEYFWVELDNPVNATFDGEDYGALAEITNDDPWPEISITPYSVIHYEGDSGTTDYEFTVELTEIRDVPITVEFNTYNHTATVADNDYIDKDIILTFNPGDSLTQTVIVEGVGDTNVEPNEQFRVKLENPTNGAISPAGDDAFGHIMNDDAIPEVSLSPATLTHSEGDSGTTGYEFTVTLSEGVAVPVTVDYSTNDDTATTADSDYVDNDGILTFNPGDPLTQTITVLVNGDTQFETDEDFTVSLDASTNSTIDGANDSATGTITNDDTPPELSLSPANVTHAEGNVGTTAYDFTVTLSESVTVPVTVNYSTTDDTATTADSDYVDNDNTLTFNPGDPLTQTITVLVNGDTKFEANADFTVSLDSSTNSTVSPTENLATGTITNDDNQPVAQISSLRVSHEEGQIGQTSYFFFVTLSNSSEEVVTIDYSTHDGTATVSGADYTGIIIDTLTFNFNQNGLTQAIYVSVHTDTVFEPDEYFTVTLNNSTNAIIDENNDYALGTILNDDVGTPNDGLMFFDPSSSAMAIYDGILDNPDEYAYTNTPPTNTAPEWVMGDWNGDGVKTPGYFDSGAFRYTNDMGPTPSWSTGFWLGNAPGRVGIVAGRFDTGFANDVGNDCIGWVDSNTNGAGDLRFSLKYWCDMTTTPQSIGGTLTPQWLAAALSDSQGFSGTHQWVYGDWDNDGLDEPGVRRGEFITRSTNAPSEGAALYGAGMAQRWAGTGGATGPGGHGFDDGVFVAGDWNGDGVDTWGVVYDDDIFYYRDVFGFNPGPFEFASQTFTSSVTAPRQVDSHHNASGGSSTPAPASPLVLRDGEVNSTVVNPADVDTSRNVEADLSVSKAGNYQVGEVGLVGDSIVWTITVSNTGTAPANGVQITDNVPAELRVDDALADNGTISVRGQVVTFTAESIEVGETVQFQVVTIILTQPSSGSFANSVNVVVPDGNGSGSDANLVASGTVSSVDGLPATGYAPKLQW